VLAVTLSASPGAMAPTINKTKLVATTMATFVSTDKFIIFPSIVAGNLIAVVRRQGDFEGTAGALMFTSTFLLSPPPPPKNWPPKKKSAAATTITKITNMATTAALLPSPLLLLAIKSILLHSVMIRFSKAM
jgi:hypothetical protein